MLLLERLDCLEVPRNRRRRREIGKVQHQQFFRVVPHPERIIHDKRFRGQPVQQMRRRDVVHIKRGVLTQPDDIKIRKVDFLFRPQFRVFALNSLHPEVVAARRDPPFLIGQMIRCIKKQAVAARLRLLGKAERTVRIDVHVPDRVHLKGDFHGRSLC